MVFYFDKSFYLVFILLFFKISHIEDCRNKVESLVATLPSKGSPSKPKPRYEDVLGLESQGPVGVDPLKMAVGTAEGPNFKDYKMPFYYNASMDSNPESDDTHRRRRDSDTPSKVSGAYQQQRQRRFIPLAAVSPALSFLNFVTNSFSSKYQFILMLCLLFLF